MPRVSDREVERWRQSVSNFLSITKPRDYEREVGRWQSQVSDLLGLVPPSRYEDICFWRKRVSEVM